MLSAHMKISPVVATLAVFPHGLGHGLHIRVAALRTRRGHAAQARARGRWRGCSVNAALAQSIANFGCCSWCTCREATCSRGQNRQPPGKRHSDRWRRVERRGGRGRGELLAAVNARCVVRWHAFFQHQPAGAHPDEMRLLILSTCLNTKP